MTPVAAANPPIPPAAPDLPPPTPAEWAVVAALTLAALALRLWRLGAVPPGLHVDEAFNILDAQAVVAGARPVFLPANAGRDVLYTYLQAPLIAALGPTATAARLASALVGAATIYDCVSASDSPWFCGPFGFLLSHVVALPEPIPCKGALGLWDVPNTVEELVRLSAGRLL